MFYKKTSFLLQIFKFDSIAVSLLIVNFIEIYWQVKIGFSFLFFSVDSLWFHFIFMVHSTHSVV